MFKDIKNNCKLLAGLALFIVFFSSCAKEEPDERPSYRWKIETKVFTGIDPVYAEGSYFIFPTNYQKGEMDILRIDEKTGDTIYNLQLISLDDNLSNSNAKAYAQGDELHILMDRNFYKIDIATGQIKEKYDFPNFFWRSNITEQYIYTASFAALDSFYFAYFDKSVGEQNIIFGSKPKADQQHIHGMAPMGNPMDIYIGYSRGNTMDMDNTVLRIRSNKIDTVTISNWKEQWIGGPSFEDRNNIYLYAVDKMFAYRKEDFSFLWELETVPGGSGPYVQTDDKIYLIPSRCIDHCDGNIMYIIDKATGEFKIVDSSASYGPMRIDGNFIYYVGGGDFFKFDITTEKFIPVREEEVSETAYQPSWGLGANSKILFDEDGWHCYPL